MKKHAQRKTNGRERHHVRPWKHNHMGKPEQANKAPNRLYTDQSEIPKRSKNHTCGTGMEGNMGQQRQHEVIKMELALNLMGITAKYQYLKQAPTQNTT